MSADEQEAKGDDCWRFSESSFCYLNVKRVPMSNIDNSSAFDLGKARRYRRVSKAGTIRAFLVLAKSSWMTDFLAEKSNEYKWENFNLGKSQGFSK